MSLKGSTKKFYGILSNYCGLGGFGTPRHKVDQLCKEHDEAYEKYIKKGINPYLSYNLADEVFMEQLKKIVPATIEERLVKLGAQGFVNMKKSVASSINDDYVTPIRPKGKKIKNITPSKKIRGSFPNLPNTTNMSKRTADEAELDSSEPMPLALRSTAGGDASAGRKGSQETPIEYYQPSYGLQETHTTILPITFYGSAILSKVEALDLRISMNNIFGILNSTFSAAAGNLSSPTRGGLFTKALYVNMIPLADEFQSSDTDGAQWKRGERPNLTRWAITKSVFPTTLASSGSTLKPEYLDYFKKLYMKYAVMKCDWDITFENCALIEGADALTAYGYNSFSSAGGREQDRFPENAKLHDVQYWKNVNWKLLKAGTPDDTQRRLTNLSSTYTIGSHKRLVTNDEDVQTWTDIDAAPLLEEELQFMMWAAPFNRIADITTHTRTLWDTGSSTIFDNEIVKIPLNMAITLKYHVQLKDLIRAYRYVQATTSPTISQVNPTDIKNNLTKL